MSHWCLVAKAFEHVGFDDTIIRQVAEQLAAVAARLSPVFEKGTGKAGEIPTISGYLKLAGLFIPAGYIRNGINLGPAGAELMADIVLGCDPGLSSDPHLLWNILY